MQNIKKGIVALALVASVLAPTLVFAQASEDPSSTGFKIISCDGPDLKTQPAVMSIWQAKHQGQVYVPCDFAGALGQIQHIINICIIVGVLVALLLFSYAGYLYVSVAITGKKDNINQAKEIFKKAVIGFVIMLVAWAIIYQLLSWISSNQAAATALLK